MYYVKFDENEYFFSTLEKAKRFVNHTERDIHEVVVDKEKDVLKDTWSVRIVIQTGDFYTFKYSNIMKDTEEVIVTKDRGMIEVNVCTDDEQEAVRVAKEKREELLKTITLKDINPYDYLDDESNNKHICIQCGKEFLGDKIRQQCKVCTLGKEAAYISNCEFTEY